MAVDVEQSKTSFIQIPAPGLATFKPAASGFGSVYQTVEGKLELVYSFTPESISASLELQPGNYTYIFRGKSATRAFYTVEKEFTIMSGKSSIVQF